MKIPIQRSRSAAEGRLRAEIRTLLGRRRRTKNSGSFSRTISHYELLKEIGVGAHGVVYLARDRRGNQLVAIKIHRATGSPQARERFLREAACISAFEHPNIVGVCELIQRQGSDALVMEYIRGKTLDRAIPLHGLPIRTYLLYAWQIADAVAAIHSAKMTHRDLKPRNFIVAKNGQVKLLDFGLAKVIDSRHQCPSRKGSQLIETRDGAIFGTVGYMSPEQVRGQTVGQRSDIFSLGTLFYQMLTGRCAFEKDTEIDSMAAILHAAPAKLPPRVPDAIARIVRRCLEKEPVRRYRTANELLDDLTLISSR